MYNHEEIYHQIGGKGSIHETQWPEFEEKLAKTSAITLVVQVNGKVKDKIEVDSESTKEELEKHALESEKVIVFIHLRTGNFSLDDLAE